MAWYSAVIEFSPTVDDLFNLGWVITGTSLAMAAIFLSAAVAVLSFYQGTLARNLNKTGHLRKIVEQFSWEAKFQVYLFCGGVVGIVSKAIPLDWPNVVLLAFWVGLAALCWSAWRVAKATNLIVDYILGNIPKVIIRAEAPPVPSMTEEEAEMLVGSGPKP